MSIMLKKSQIISYYLRQPKILFLFVFLITESFTLQLNSFKNANIFLAKSAYEHFNLTDT